MWPSKDHHGGTLADQRSWAQPFGHLICHACEEATVGTPDKLLHEWLLPISLGPEELSRWTLSEFLAYNIIVVNLSHWVLRWFCYTAIANQSTSSDFVIKQTEPLFPEEVVWDDFPGIILTLKFYNFALFSPETIHLPVQMEAITSAWFWTGPAPCWTLRSLGRTQPLYRGPESVALGPWGTTVTTVLDNLHS